jgi:hypothetical protein
MERTQTGFWHLLYRDQMIDFLAINSLNILTFTR